MWLMFSVIKLTKTYQRFFLLKWLALMFGSALESAKSRGPMERTGGRHHANLAGNHLEASQTGFCGGRESNLVAVFETCLI